MTEPTNCWNCGKDVQEIHFCGACRSLQPPASDYYDFFGLEPRLDLDTQQLEKRYYTLSRRLHPDVYFRRSVQERQYSLDATATLNDAYRTLRDPISRAEYLLKQNGFDIGEQGGKEVPPELLEEVFELNMALEELRLGDESARPQLERAREQLVAMRDETDRDLAEKFRAYDATLDRAVLGGIRGMLNRRRYVRNLLDEIEKEGL